MSNSAPIGVFDSGIGGLTVAREIMRQLPNESIIYYGDTARVPYGPKSPDTVIRYSNEIVSFLQGEGVKAIVVACNTATAHALPFLKESFSLPIIGVIDPGSRAAVAASKSGKIGVIGTQGTVGSHAYQRAIQQLAPNVTVVELACPLFVPLVEEGWLDTEPTRLIAEEYLSPLRSEGVDTVVLGCTHYPLLKTVIGKTIGREVRLIDSAEETAKEIGSVLSKNGLSGEKDSQAHYRFIASDTPDQVLRLGQRFLGSAIDRVEKITLG